MGRKPGFKHSDETKKNISAGVKRSQPEGWFVFEVATDKGIFYGNVQADIKEQAESLIKGIFKNAFGLSISSIVQRKRVPKGDNTFTIISKDKGQLRAGRGLWVAAGRGKEFDERLAQMEKGNF